MPLDMDTNEKAAAMQNETKDSAHPHGKCECDGGLPGGCCLGEGPAAYEVERDGKRVRLCTRCILSDDRESARLLVTKDESPEPYREHDGLGFFCLLGELLEREQAS